ncbi:hypothetical protein A2801_03180 [Candidatus Woesebacteria bacterium RIFCSPHIGHO2_01_FULL_41_10]|uniref:Peptidase M48 domain-containing protein n=1 Tax=Candidatus Woesebacteria bacterium RIFCSPHIGHO2_01_FULL_41_10 TaxID=1802500 RepID=A0A1F7YS62_9BACT|nr:MAG: hypothetical protein A2801_03180 [Candidatus Woesebacteria bacterium RIFCSPHIGHO2_01_FULL_41_10]
MNILLFVIIFLYTTNWVRVLLLKDLFNRSNNKKLFSKFNNEKYLAKVNKKAKLKFDIRVQESPAIYGYMAGLPIAPFMVVSSGAIKQLSLNELEWIVLHEVGHCVMWHVAKNALGQALFLIGGIVLLVFLKLNIIFIPVYAVLLGIVWYQIERVFELNADKFSLARIDDPRGMITANQKMKAKGKSIFYKNLLLGKLFTPHLSYDERIEMAKLKL